MKLYNHFLSPFACRPRIQLYAKGLEAEFVLPPGGLEPGGITADAFRAITPLGRVPTLEVDGHIIVESSVIAEYLEDRFPEPALRPKDPVDRARMRTVMQVFDEHFVPPLFEMLGVRGLQVPEGEHPQRIAQMGEALDLVEHYLEPAPFAVGSELSLADCFLTPFVMIFTRFFDLSRGERPKLAAWWQTVQGCDPCARVLREQEQAAAAAFGEKWREIMALP